MVLQWLRWNWNLFQNPLQLFWLPVKPNVYDDNDKNTFKYGMKASGLSAMELREGAAVNEYVNKDATLEGENLTISANSSVIGI